MKLEEVPSGESVFADATIFVYHFAGVSPACRSFLERCERGDVKAVTSSATLAEVSHRLMMMEAVTRGLISRGNVAKKLRQKPGVTKKLHSYRESVEKIPLMGFDVHSLDLKVLLEAAKLGREHGLMTNDSIMAASALAAGVEYMATADRDFRRVRKLSVAVPSDLPNADA